MKGSGPSWVWWPGCGGALRHIPQAEPGLHRPSLHTGSSPRQPLPEGESFSPDPLHCSLVLSVALSLLEGRSLQESGLRVRLWLRGASPPWALSGENVRGQLGQLAAARATLTGTVDRSLSLGVSTLISVCVTVLRVRPLTCQERETWRLCNEKAVVKLPDVLTPGSLDRDCNRNLIYLEINPSSGGRAAPSWGLWV